jgi:PAS domain S-box-containing protein
MARELAIVSAVLLTIQSAGILRLGSSRTGRLLSSLIELTAILLATVAAFRAHRRAAGVERSFWMLMRSSFLLWLIAEANWTCYQSWSGAPLFSFSWPHFLFRLAGLPVLLSVFLTEEERPSGIDWQRILDSIQVCAVLLFLYFGLYIVHAMRAGAAHYPVFGAFYASDIENWILFVALAARGGLASSVRIRAASSRMAIFLFVFAASVWWGNFQVIRWKVERSPWFELAWTLSFLLAAALAETWRPLPDVPARAPAKSVSLPHLLGVNFAPALIPILLISLALYVEPDERAVALAAVVLSMFCFGGRAAITQYRQAKTVEALHRSESELLASEERYSQLVELAPVGIAVYVDGKFVFLNRTGATMLGAERPDELLGRSVLDLVQPADQAKIEGRKHLVEAGEKVPPALIRALRLDGAEAFLEAASIPITYRGQPAIQTVFRDVTAKLQLEEQFRQAQKMEAIGQLAGGVAHDFNNLLGVIIGYSDLMLGTVPADDPDCERIEKIRNAGEAAASLTRQLLAFSRRQVLEPRVLDLNKVVDETHSMLRRVIGENIEIRTRLGSGLGRIHVDPVQLEQVILNLAINARDAMPEGGRLTIETSNAEMDEAYARKHPVVQPGSFVLLTVSDTGVGMDKETLARVFEPFFTTKERGKGTGLGLSTVYGIVKQSGGFVWAYSEPGQGATFKVYLPRVDQLTTASSLPHAQVEARGSETILLVEDEEPLREMIREMLEGAGYAIVSAGTPEEALRLAERYSSRLDLLLTDVILPGMSGRELAEAVLRMKHGVRVLFMSGYADDIIGRHGVLDPEFGFLEKPFHGDELRRKVRDLLDASSTTGA